MTGGDARDAGFLSRWSRRKAAARVSPVEDEPAPEAVEPDPVPEAAPDDSVDESEMSDSELLARYELPDPETLTAEDDVRAFMRAGIPARLRTLALRRLWRLDPVLANVDGLVEYGLDYTDAATVIPNLKTVYQVGRGAAAYLQDLADRTADAAESVGSDTADAGAAEPEPVEPVEADPGEGEVPEPVAPPEVQTAVGDRPDPNRAAIPLQTDNGARRRHMVFATRSSRPDGADT